MKCEDSRELLTEYALDQLDPEATLEVREHLNRGCSVCVQKLDEIVETWASLGASLDPVTPSPEIETKLLRMIRGTPATPLPSVDLCKGRSEGTSHVLAFALAASLVGIAAAVVVWRFTPLQRLVVNRGDAVIPQEVWASSPVGKLRSGFQTVSLEPIAEPQGVGLSVVMIPQSGEWHVVARGLPNVDEGKKLQIWLETRTGGFQELAVLPVEQPGRGGVIVDAASFVLAEIAGLWLTVESETAGLHPSEYVLFRATVR